MLMIEGRGAGRDLTKELVCIYITHRCRQQCSESRGVGVVGGGGGGREEVNGEKGWYIGHTFNINVSHKRVYSMELVVNIYVL